MNQIELPSKINKLVECKSYTIDDIGMSGNSVLIFDDMVLKIEKETASIKQQIQMMQWLEGKLPVPKVIAYEECGGKSYLLMSRMAGESPSFF